MKDNYRGAQVGPHEPIAIIGMSCDLPGGSTSPEAFFDFLKKRKCGVVEIPADRWDTRVFYDVDKNGIAKSVSKWGGFIDGIRDFDARFFGIAPREAAAMDPQQRMVLQGTVEAMMDAQIPLEEFSRQSTGVFVGISQSDYRTLREMRLTSNESYAGTGYALCITANRVSHRLNLRGPSYAVDTACSSSLTALNQAMQNLMNGACDMAVVCGVNALIHPSSFIAFSKAGMISPTGRISTFDAQANGFVRAEGIGTVIIKTLSRAQADGDRIHAVIQGSAVNQDGATNTITAPNQQAQTAMLRALFDSVSVTPDQIGFVEAHGTGTPIGDPIEAGAIGTVIGQNVPDRAVYVGSCKANVGHLESGAGITGLIKTAMAVKTGIVPPNIHFKTANPNIPFDALNLQVPVKPEAFPETETGRHAVVNSFGFGGTNACALLSSAPPANFDHHPIPQSAATPQVEVGETGFPHLFALSGATQEGVPANAKAMLKAIGARGKLADVPLRDIAAALATQRSHLMYRAVILARTSDELKSRLRKLAAGKTEADGVITGQTQDNTTLCFTFSGQGSQWWAMGRNLLEHNATFADAVAAFDAEFEPVAGWSIRAELLRDKDSSRIDDTTVTQPALFAIQSGLAALWKQLGITPDMVAGHSIGEAAASYVAGGLSLSGAAKFLSKRGAIRDQLGMKGAMAAIGMNHADVEAILPEHGKLGIAAINGPGSTTISGDFDALHDFVEDFQMLRPDTFIRALTVDTAWHSYHLDNGEAWFRKEMASIDWSVPHLPFISTVTGKPETRFDTDYGWLNLRRPVRFQAAVETALELGAAHFVELGPAATLAGPTTSTALEAGATVKVLNSINRKDNDFDAMARAAATLFVAGHALNWAAITGKPMQPVELPQNAWIKEPFWQDSEESRDVLFNPRPHPFLGVKSKGNGTTWHGEVNLRALPYLSDHRLQSEVLFPAAGYIDTMLAACREIYGADVTVEMEDLVIHETLFVQEEQDVLLSIVFDPTRGRVKFYSRVRDQADDWVLRSEVKVRVTDVPPPPGRLPDVTAKGFEHVDLGYIYEVDLASSFVNYGPAFQTVEKVWMSRSRTVGKLVLQDVGGAGKAMHHVHPAMLDGCLQLLEPSMNLKRYHNDERVGDVVTLPVGAGRLRFYRDFPDEVIVDADQFDNDDLGGKKVGFTVYDLDGNVLMTAHDLRLSFLPAKKERSESEEVPASFVRESLSEVRIVPAVTEAALGRWVVLETQAGDNTALINALQEAGAQTEVIARDALGDVPGDTLVDLLGDDIEAGEIAGVLVTWPLAILAVDAQADTDALFDPIEACTQDMISLGELMDFAREGAGRLPAFTFLTSGAYPQDGAKTGPEILSQLPLAALVRGLATEAQEYKIRLIDVTGQAGAIRADLAAHILSDCDEAELILRDGKCLAPRLNTVTLDDLNTTLLEIDKTDTSTNFHATMATPGIIDNLMLAEIPLEPVGADQVRVRVSAVGLNFRDVMAVTGLLPTEAEPEPAWQNLGLEYGAVVEAVGDNVTKFKPGDRVMGMGRRCLQRYLTTDAAALTLVPAHISLAEASTIPSAFATAHYALNHIGRMRAGDRVLIHVATGGVGTAAIQLAQAAGAEIFATAGSPAKRKRLRDLGITHVMDSRSLKFADDVMRITDGTGVDVLLNSLPGEYITRGLDIMAPYGRFLEIGKRDVYDDSAIGMKALRRNVSLSVLDLAAMGLERPDLMGGLFDELAQMLDARTLTPLPLTEFPISQISDAVRYMSQAKHMGKVVVTLEEDSFAVRRDENRPATLSPEASYLVTGGTAGFSLTTADWLSQAGAGHLILASRSGKVSKPDQKRIAKIEKRGTGVTVMALDVSDAAAVTDFVTQQQKSKQPIKGVLHGAAVIKDGLANQLTPEMITDVLTPKIKGAWNLHRAFAQSGVEPDFMIGFSSIAQVLGSVGQTNYIAGNAFLDALAHYRTAQGLAGNAIDWGVIAEAGFVARNASLETYLESTGQYGLRANETGAALEVALTRHAPALLYARADWEKVGRANPTLGKSPRMAGLMAAEEGGTTQVRTRMMALSGDELVTELLEYVKDELTNVLKIDRSEVQIDRSMTELGLDSLSSFELKVRIETALGMNLVVSKFLQAPTIGGLAEMLAGEVDATKASAAAVAADDDSPEAATGAAQDTQRNMASNHQLGMLRLARAALSSEASRMAMEHVAQSAVSQPVPAKELARHLRKIERRHGLLMQRIDAEGHLYADGPGLIVLEEDRPLNPDAGEFAAVFSSDKRIRVRLHAALGDASSARLIADELAALVAGKALAKPVSRKAVTAFLNAQRYVFEDPQSQQDRSFWWYALTSQMAKPVPFATRSRAALPPHAGSNHGQTAVIEGTLPQDLDDPALLVAFAKALRHATQSTGATLIGLKRDLRGTLPAGAAVGPFEIEQPILVPETMSCPIAAAQFARMMQAAPDHIRVDSHVIADIFGALFAEQKTTPFQALVERLPQIPAAAPGGTLHDVWLQVADTGAQARLRLIYDQDVIDRDVAQAIMDRMVSQHAQKELAH